MESERRESMAGLQQAVPFTGIGTRMAIDGRRRHTGGCDARSVGAHDRLLHSVQPVSPSWPRERLAELYPATKERLLEIHNLRSLATEYLEAGRLEPPSRS